MVAFAPEVNINVRDGALGNVPPSPANVFAVMGPSQGGTENLPTLFAGQPGDVVTQYGYGPGPSLVAALVASGIPCVFTKVPTDSPGVAGSVTHVGDGLSIMTVTGAPLDRYDVVATVVRGGTAGDDVGPTVAVTFDGGKSTNKAVRVPASRSLAAFVTTTGLTLVFSAASMVAGDTYSFSCSAPTVAAVDVASAIDALRVTTKQAALGYCVGEFSAADAAVIGAAVGELKPLGRRYTRWIVESRDQASDETLQEWIDSLEADFVDYVNDRVAVPGGYCLALDPVTRMSLRRSVGFLAAVRLGLISVGVDPSRVADGALVPFLGASAATSVFYDEFLTPGLGPNRFFTLQSYIGYGGYFVSCPNLMSGPTSDFDLVQLGRIMDESCRVADIYFTSLLGQTFRVGLDGFIIATDRLAIEAGSNQAQAVALVNNGQVSRIFTQVGTSDNVLATRTLSVTVSIVPNADVRRINVEMTYYNPANFVSAA